MSIFGLIVKELRYRWISSLGAALGIALAVALCLALPALYDAADRETTRLQRDLGFNLRILPADADMDQFYVRGFALETMPEEVVGRLAEQRTLAYNHLVATLQQEVQVGGGPALLVGISPTYFPPGSQKPPMSPDIQPGTAHLGRQIAERLGVEVGDRIEASGRSFEVVRVAPQAGDADDIRIWVALDDAQEALGMAGLINEVKAIDCLCLTPEEDPQAQIQAEVSRVAPEARVAMLNRMAATRAGQRRMIERFGRFAAPAAILIAAVWVCLFSMVNVRQRRQELGLLRAMGYGPSMIGGLFLGKALVLGLLGAAGGAGLAWLCVSAAAPRLFPVTAAGASLTAAAVRQAVLWTPLAAAIASAMPIALALLQSPARVLAKEQL